SVLVRKALQKGRFFVYFSPIFFVHFLNFSLEFYCCLITNFLLDSVQIDFIFF
ncbi:hypothetical protein D046_4076, partial [Vibrio parahaemolyticus V-223/04]